MTAKGRQRHFEMLLQAHRGIIFKVAGSYSRTAHDREDLAQEICTQLWRSFPSYNPQRKFSTWMYRVALNVAISQARRERWSETDHFEPLNAHHLETIGSADNTTQQDERLEVMYTFIGRLDALNRALILLYLEDRSYSEIADILGISETNVATKINRVKQKLRNQMNITGTTTAENAHGTR